MATMRIVRRIAFVLVASAAVVLAVLFLPQSSGVRPVWVPHHGFMMTRFETHSVPGGARYRTFVWGADYDVRMDLDVDGDGHWDLRGEDWQEQAPTRCLRRRD